MLQDGTSFFCNGTQGAAAAAPPWVQALQANMNQQFANVNLQLVKIANDIAAIRAEQPILLANSQAGNHGPLYDPTLPGWVLLGFPHPTTRDELVTFTRESLCRNFIIDFF